MSIRYAVRRVALQASAGIAGDTRPSSTVSRAVPPKRRISRRNGDCMTHAGGTFTAAGTSPPSALHAAYNLPCYPYRIAKHQEHSGIIYFLPVWHAASPAVAMAAYTASGQPDATDLAFAAYR